MKPKTTAEQPPPKGRHARSHRKQTTWLDLSSQLFRIAGVDLTQIDGIQVQTAQTVISEVGVDMSRWRTEKQFASWLGLCPDNRISGGKVLKRGTRHVVNRASTALRMAAWSLFRSQSALGANFRRLRRKLGAPKADTALAHKLARLVYRMLKFGQGYVDKGMEHYEAKYRQDQIKLAHEKRSHSKSSTHSIGWGCRLSFWRLYSISRSMPQPTKHKIGVSQRR
jgi:hypothetical protein